MPIDPMMLDPILTNFRRMAKEIEDKGITGADVDELNAVLQRMEELGRDLNDFNEFNGVVMQENLYAKFSDYYGKVLTAAASVRSDDGYNDAALLNQALDAFRDAIRRIREGKQQAIDHVASHSDEQMTEQAFAYLDRNAGEYGIDTKAKYFQDRKKEAFEQAKDSDEKAKRMELFLAEIEQQYNEEALIQPIESLIRLGEEEGMTYPGFLRLQIERGLDKAMEGSVLLREGLVFEDSMAKAAMQNPYEVGKRVRKIEVFDQLPSKVSSGVPNSLEVTLAHAKIDWELEPSIVFWNELKRRIFNIMDKLESIVIANSQYFPSYMPYLMMSDHNKKVQHAEWVKNCVPGILKEEERLLNHYFGLSFEDIFEHEIFIWEVENYHISSSQVYTEFLKDEVYPEVIPCEFLSKATIAKFENDFHNQKTMGNPEAYLAEEKRREAYDNHFGEGYSETKLGEMERTVQNAAPWNLSTFK